MKYEYVSTQADMCFCHCPLPSDYTDLLNSITFITIFNEQTNFNLILNLAYSEILINSSGELYIAIKIENT